MSEFPTQSFIIPLETEKEQTFREQTFTALNHPGLGLHDSGAMDIICEECGARHFKGKKPQDTKFSQCCKKGRFILPPPKDGSQYFYPLLDVANTVSEFTVKFTTLRL